MTFRFVADPGVAISDLLNGTCDILDPSIPLDGQTDLLRSMADQNQLQALFSKTPVMEELALGVKPASYDNGIDVGVDRPNYFGDVRVRQAIAYCLDRQQVVDTVLSGLSSVPNSYLPEEDILYNPDVTAYSFNVAAAGKLLDQAGWKDIDNDPSTPRQAWGVPGIPSGTPFVVNYATTNAVQRQQVTTILAGSLAAVWDQG